MHLIDNTLLVNQIFDILNKQFAHKIEIKMNNAIRSMGGIEKGVFKIY